ncbi:MAG: hypothetical protein HC809_02090 [Gammaproteobacteria bacterium]|nr:hypothetical protein [Gammaproteobacteria bacterium]
MAQGPVTALVMHPVVRDELLRADHLERIRAAAGSFRQTPSAISKPSQPTPAGFRC